MIEIMIKFMISFLNIMFAHRIHRTSSLHNHAGFSTFPHASQRNIHNFIPNQFLFQFKSFQHNSTCSISYHQCIYRIPTIKIFFPLVQNPHRTAYIATNNTCNFTAACLQSINSCKKSLCRATTGWSNIHYNFIIYLQFIHYKGRCWRNRVIRSAGGVDQHFDMWCI